MSLKIKNPKIRKENNIFDVIDFGVEISLEGIRDAKSMGGEVYEEFCRILGSGIIEGLQNIGIQI